MKYTFFFIISIMLMFSCRSNSSTASIDRLDFYLLDTFTMSDINYNDIDSIDLKSFPRGRSNLLNSVFKPVNGKYRVYRFLSYDYGITYENHADSINILIEIKIDENNVIVDGFLYFLQNPSFPSIGDVFRLSAKGLKLRNGMNVESLEFKRYIDSMSTCTYYKKGMILFHSVPKKMSREIAKKRKKVLDEIKPENDDVWPVIDFVP